MGKQVGMVTRPRAQPMPTYVRVARGRVRWYHIISYEQIMTMGLVSVYLRSYLVVHLVVHRYRSLGMFSYVRVSRVTSPTLSPSSCQ